LEDEAENFDSNTVGGWVTEVYGEIPPVGEVVTCKHLQIKVVKANQQKVLKVRTKRHDDYDEAEYDEKNKDK
jgi:Mg2+/Co2+ transporter CorC